MVPSPLSTSLTITNPLVKYRSLLASHSLHPDPAQHRLALHLEKIYARLKDYSPELEYRHRLATIRNSVGYQHDRLYDARESPIPLGLGLLPNWNFWRPDTSFAMTPTVPIQESALSIDSPQGLLLYGEVGRGKSMILDLFADALPTERKRRWHFNAFMLETFQRLERLRIERSADHHGDMLYENSVLSLAKNLVCQSPIIFLDEFQFPDRAASKLLSSFLTSFFHLGGVLIATSNRMPDELAKAAGLEYPYRPNKSPRALRRSQRGDEADKAAVTDFGAFLDILKARCEIWEMEGNRDWRRLSQEDTVEATDSQYFSDALSTVENTNLETPSTVKIPKYYSCSDTSNLEDAIVDEAKWQSKIKSCLNDVFPGEAKPGWVSSSIKVFGREFLIPNGIAAGYTRWDFSRLCGANLGPADYISLASTYHTLILDQVPVLSLSLKNEARRFITLLDALYESKCRLLMRADALPDSLFFPEMQGSGAALDGTDESGSEIYQETLAEIYQDTTNPFRPNISSYQQGGLSTQDGSPIVQSSLRSVLADEDADFGLNYATSGGHRTANQISGFVTERASSGPDFTQIKSLTGEDEKFAYKRARSRLWELCGEKWWRERPAEKVDEWWKPVPPEARFWEKPADKWDDRSLTRPKQNLQEEGDNRQSQSVSNSVFRHVASPFRTSTEPPPRFGWQHAWGMMKWGKKAGAWGQGPEARQGAKLAPSPRS